MKRRGVFIFISIVALVFCFSFSALGEEGVTDTEIHIGQWGPQTGPAAPWGAVARGTGVLFKMINEEGGIHGRKIVYHMFDDAYNPAKTKAGVKELQESVGIFAWAAGVGTACGLSVKDYLMERKIPWVGPSAGSLHWINPPQKYLFAVYPLYVIEAKALCRYAVKNLGLKRIAIAYQNDDYGKNGLKGAERELSKYGMKLVAKVPVEKADTDMRPHVMKLRKAKADAVLLWVTPVHAVRILGTGHAMKFNPQWMSTSTCSDFPLMYKISKGLWKGVIVANFAELPDSQSPLMLKYKKAFQKYAAKGERWGVFFYAGIGFTEPLVEGLKRCGRNLTRERLVKEMEGIKNFKGIFGRISYKPFDPNDPSCRQGQNEVFLSQCLEGAKSKQLTDWMEIQWQ
ncbi:MAG: ABC transporter substrate-binding protein [Deltaproteobacteria bacterium]|nr:ABC transporter substrate-binding protein [Deltaproteobacteria bacterium]MBW1927542.1 ABC transporter substrate-binding protein [Deltaproteobacteria bacterium]MBW2126523.1 ABC transporter substrate-binding protein [Deltaproteobacteria bacterium]